MHEVSSRAGKRQIDPATLFDLVKVLAQHPSGLRRWSVMRAIRAERATANREIPQRIEDEVERVFRSRCENFSQDTETALFYLPKEKAGEVWAVYPERAVAVLADTAKPEAT
jgi:hypothetical protein